ncbi:J domain-containing protein, partial [Pseudorhizobium endolithicum]|uniref:J domain-containing protein n=1 Tax=Pseudorhizobium endolithicum TaxID=1191678 RepID=UPI0011583D62
MRDPYSVLGVQRNAGADEIKAAWRSKAKSVHPDHNQDDPSASNRFAEVGRAYEVLKDPERRKRYDRAVEAHQTILQQRQAAREAAERAKAAKANAEKVMEELARANAQRAQAQAQAQANSQAGAAPEPAEDMVERIFGSPSDRGAKQTGTSGGGQAQAASSTAAAAGDPGAFQDAQVQEGSATAATPQDPKPLPAQAVELIASLVRRIRGVGPAPDKAPDHAVEAYVTLEDLLKQSWLTVRLPEDRDVRFPLEAGMTAGHV